jgi:hypothetical protein
MTPSRSAFVELIEAYRSRGYAFRSFHDYAPDGCILLRHDIDFSVFRAEEIARVEADLGVRASYFFMLTSNLYNLLSQASRQAVGRIQAMGHTVSLHFDPVVHGDVDRGFEAEKRIVEDAFGPIDIVSIHRPGPFLNDNNRALPGCAHTYQDRWFRDLAYISDSGGSFRHAHPVDNPAVEAGKSLQLLLHPVWWTVSGDTPTDQLLAWRDDHIEFLTDEMALNCKTFLRDRVTGAAA